MVCAHFKLSTAGNALILAPPQQVTSTKRTSTASSLPSPTPKTIPGFTVHPDNIKQPSRPGQQVESRSSLNVRKLVAMRRKPRSCNNKKGIIWAQSCTVRYSNISIFGVLEYDPLKNVPSPNNVSNPEQYKQARDPLFVNLSEKAAAGDSDLKFAAGNVSVPVTNETIYATVRCSPDLDKQNCSDCLKESISEIPECCGGVGGGRVLRPSCYLRFESNPF
ncbi:hypothetical protein L3X38_021101 [Prunus dulcis]|uniref:Gnk2-homologous domain-containing protein n=1 Tax=Prunus dulcis TaxID=3755 RepID=A0AAD4VTC9_PRUDU|nr:hypothetical protein L3X38_021101 [Prunus dulcis]